jgi:hypothetical protein
MEPGMDEAALPWVDGWGPGGRDVESLYSLLYLLYLIYSQIFLWLKS